jgi:hypothetical protein
VRKYYPDDEEEQEGDGEQGCSDLVNVDDSEKKRKSKPKGKGKGKGKVEQPHVAYKRIREQLIDVIKERGVNSREQAAQWVDETKERLDQVLADLSGELDEAA